jgi:hypothetical protein
MIRRERVHPLIGALAVVALCAVAVAAVAAPGQMQSTKLGPRLCETTGGGKFVRIPGFPGEQIDRRLLTDIQWLERRYPIFITDGYSLDPVHAENGEHPIGLALDIVPNAAEGGRWSDITALAHWAEPRQDHPRSPFRWVGYNGDPGHGRGNHLHLSWDHSTTRPGRPAAIVDTIRCPIPGAGTTPPPTEPPIEPPPPPTGGATSSGAHTHGGGNAHEGRRAGQRREGGRDGRRHQSDGRRHQSDGRRHGSGARGHAGGIGRGSRGLPASGGISRSKSGSVVVEGDESFGY